jgi:lipoprotein NlpD
LKHYFWIALLLLAGCATDYQAPVIERGPTAPKKTVKPAPPVAKKTAPAEKDWRPDSYTVKKGDTLYSIGLEFGFDNKEIAQWNNIQPPYTIYIGQQLRLKDPRATASAPAAPADSDVAVATPLKLEPAPTAKPLDGKPINGKPIEAAPAQPDAIPLLTEPKALKEPYSAKALTVEPAPKPAATVIKPVPPTDKPAATAEKPAVAETPKPAEQATEKPAMPADDEALEWSWPAKGKILAGFNDSGSSKGMDIAGDQGQPVHAAAPGKVVYSGTGLRGYGKLIIIKHNKTYLSAYAHNSQLLVKEGQLVTKGQKIAEMGNSDTDRVKLHFEIRKLGKPVDPAKYLPESSD